MPNELDMDAYHQEGIDPGQHKVFNIAPTIHSFATPAMDPIEMTRPWSMGETGMGVQYEGMTNETGWMEQPTFEERWKGQQSPEEVDESIDEMLKRLEDPDKLEIQWYLRNKLKPKGWTANQFPQSSPSMDTILESQKQWSKQEPILRKDFKSPSLLWQGPSTFPGIPEGETTIAPYNPDKPEVYNYPISDKQVPFSPYSPKSIEDIAAKHKVDAGQVKDIINDLAHHPENFIGPGELGVVRTMGILPKSFSAYGNRATSQQSAVIADQFAKSSIWSNPENIEKAISMYKSGNTLQDIGNELGTSKEMVQQMFSRGGIETRVGTHLGPTVYTEDFTRHIQKLRDQGLSWPDISERVGIEPSALRQQFSKSEYQRKTPTLSEWMKNQFEGAPTDPELIDSMKQYLKDTPDILRPANLNKELPTSPPYGYSVFRMHKPEDTVGKTLKEIYDAPPKGNWILTDDKGRPLHTGKSKQDVLNRLYSNNPELIKKAYTKPSFSDYDKAIMQKKMQDIIDREVREQKKSKFKIVPKEPE